MQKTEETGCLNAINLTLKHGFCDKSRTLEDISKTIHMPMKDFFFMKQVHENNVVIATEDTYLKPADAVIDTEGKYKLVIRTADCLPILVQSKSGKIKAAIHAGWRSLLSGIIENTIEKMKTLTDEPFLAALGPCMQNKHFEVKQDLIERFPINIQNDTEIFIHKDEKVFFDVPKLAIRKLNNLGIVDVNTDCCIDTYENENYYSYRRSTHKDEIDDRRQLSWI